MGIDTGGSFNRATERKYILSNLNTVLSETSCIPISVHSADVSEVHAQTEGSDNWNLSAILCGDGEFHLSHGSYFGSSSLDGAVSGFWSLIWNSLNISWAPKKHYHLIDWPYRAVTRNARLLRRQGKAPRDLTSILKVIQNPQLYFDKRNAQELALEESRILYLNRWPWRSSA